MLWNGSKEDGDVRSKGREDEDTDREDGGSSTNWQRYRENVTCFMYQVHKINSKILFNSYFISGGGHLTFG